MGAALRMDQTNYVLFTTAEKITMAGTPPAFMGWIGLIISLTGEQHSQIRNSLFRIVQS